MTFIKATSPWQIAFLTGSLTILKLFEKYQDIWQGAIYGFLCSRLLYSRSFLVSSLCHITYKHDIVDR